MFCKQTDNYYVCINRKEDVFPNLMVKVFVKEGDSFSQTAKYIRKFAVENNWKALNLKPSDCTWSVYRKEVAKNHERFSNGEEYFVLVDCHPDGLYNKEILLAIE